MQSFGHFSPEWWLLNKMTKVLH